MSFDQGHALVVGVGYDLPCTVRDAQAIADLFRDPGICAYPRGQVELLTEETATAHNFNAALGRLAAVDEKSTVVIYFSGHGYQVKSKTEDDCYLMPFGYDIDDLAATAINGKDFTAAIDRIPANRVLLLLDCCHAGGIELSQLKDVRGLKLKSLEMPPEIKDHLGHGDGRVVIASSRADEKSLTGNPYSVFTTALLESLRGKGAAKQDGLARVIDIAMHTREVVPYLTKLRQHPVLDIKRADNFAVSFYAGGAHTPKAIPATVVWTPVTARVNAVRTASPTARRRSKTDHISFKNFRTFARWFLGALQSELQHTGIGDLLIPEYDYVESYDDEWYFYFEAANSPLNARVEDDPGYYFALTIEPQEGRVADRKALARMYCVVGTNCIAATRLRSKIEVRKQLLEHLRRDTPNENPAEIFDGDIWLEIGVRRISSFDRWTADMIATVFANKIPVIEDDTKAFLADMAERDRSTADVDRLVKTFKESGLIP